MPGDDDRIDLMQQIIDLFEKEEMLAYFDFAHEVAEDGGRYTIEGLCKISKPKEGESMDNCLYLTFVLDAFDEDMWTKVDVYVKQVEWESLPDHVDGIESVLPMPTESDADSGNYLKQVDIYLHKDVAIDRTFLSTKLFHAIVQIAGLRAHDITLWEDHDAEELTKKIEAINSGMPKL